MIDGRSRLDHSLSHTVAALCQPRPTAWEIVSKRTVKPERGVPIETAHADLHRSAEPLAFLQAVANSIRGHLRVVGWPDRVRSTGRVAQRQEAAPCGFNCSFARDTLSVQCRTCSVNLSEFQFECPNSNTGTKPEMESAWRSLVSLARPCRDQPTGRCPRTRQGHPIAGCRS